MMNSQEWTCLWYLRLNGYFTIPNFIVHGRPAALTDIDVLAVRFPYSSESLLIDDGELGIPKGMTDIIFAEAKRGEITSLNGPWRDPQAGALNRVLQRVGILPPDRVGRIATELYEKKSASDNRCTIRVCAFAESISPELRQGGVHFIGWRHVLRFVHQRFRGNKQFKADHGMWDDYGQYLWNMLNDHDPCEPEELFDGWDKRNSRRD